MLLVCMFLTKLSETDSMKVARGHKALQWDLCSQLSTMQLDWHSRENTRICKFTSGALFSLHMSTGSLSTCDRYKRVCRRCSEHCAACKIVQHDQFGSVMVWGEFLEGHTDLKVIANGTLTTVW